MLTVPEAHDFVFLCCCIIQFKGECETIELCSFCHQEVGLGLGDTITLIVLALVKRIVEDYLVCLKKECLGCFFSV